MSNVETEKKSKEVGTGAAKDWKSRVTLKNT